MTTAPRPRSVTLACLLMGLSCLVLMISIIGQLENWGSLELQEQVGNALESGPLSSASITVAEALVILRWVFLGVLVLSIAGMVFAVFTARGDRTSRNFLTGVWAIIGWSLAGSGGAGVIGLVLAVLLVYLLWHPESRRWFAAVNGETKPAATPSAFATSPTPPPMVGPSHPEAPVAVSDAVRPPPLRPRSVMIATTITLIGSGFIATTSTFMLATLALVGGDFEKFVAENPRMETAVADAGLATDQVLQVMLIAMASTLALSLVGFAMALLALTRKRAGLVGLAIVTSLTLAVSILGFPVGIPWTVASIVVLVQLRRSESKAWFSTT